MGKYYTIVNHTKKERIEPRDLGDLAKFQEFVPGSGRTLAALAILLKGGWAGDQVEILDVGAEKAKDIDSTYRNISHILVGMVDDLPRRRTLRHACKKVKKLDVDEILSQKSNRESRSCEGTEYKPVSEMPFNYALQRMNEGLRVRRAAWAKGLALSISNSLKDLTWQDVSSDDWEVVDFVTVRFWSQSSRSQNGISLQVGVDTYRFHQNGNVYLDDSAPPGARLIVNGSEVEDGHEVSEADSLGVVLV